MLEDLLHFRFWLWQFAFILVVFEPIFVYQIIQHRFDICCLYLDLLVEAEWSLCQFVSHFVLLFGKVGIVAQIVGDVGLIWPINMKFLFWESFLFVSLSWVIILVSWAPAKQLRISWPSLWVFFDWTVVIKELECSKRAVAFLHFLSRVVPPDYRVLILVDITRLMFLIQMLPMLLDFINNRLLP